MKQDTHSQYILTSYGMATALKSSSGNSFLNRNIPEIVNSEDVRSIISASTLLKSRRVKVLRSLHI